jgi:hypothetical protein
MNEMSFEINKKLLSGSPQFHAIHIQSWKNYFRFSTPDIFPATVFAIFMEIIYINYIILFINKMSLEINNKFLTGLYTCISRVSNLKIS